MFNYNPANWYWVVGGSVTQVFSSSRLAYVALSDSQYVSWQSSGGVASMIDTDSNLQNVLYKAEVLVINIISTSAPAINGAYAISQSTKLDIEGVVDNIELNNTFPGEASAMAWLDVSGTPHVFPSTTIFKEFATAYATYVSAIEEYINTGEGSAPSNSMVIA